MEYLVREIFLSPSCDPLDFAGIAAHLYYLEPSNFLFVHLLRRGAFDGKIWFCVIFTDIADNIKHRMTGTKTDNPGMCIVDIDTMNSYLRRFACDRVQHVQDYSC